MVDPEKIVSFGQIYTREARWKGWPWKERTADEEEDREADERSTVLAEAREETLDKVKDPVPREFLFLIYAGTCTPLLTEGTCQPGRKRWMLEKNSRRRRKGRPQ